MKNPMDEQKSNWTATSWNEMQYLGMYQISNNYWWTAKSSSDGGNRIKL